MAARRKKTQSGSSAGQARNRRSAGGKRRFPGLSRRAYEHPADRAAFSALRNVPGFDFVVRKMLGMLNDRAIRLQWLGNGVRVGPEQFPKVHELYGEALEVLDLEPAPELYVTQRPEVNAMAMGFDRPVVVLNSASLGLFDEQELQFVLAHELGHVLSGHVTYRTVLFFLLRLPAPARLPLQLLLAAAFEWIRKSELSADRAGLLAAQDPEVARRVCMKLAGGSRTDQMSAAEFEAQAEEYRAGGNIVDSLLKLLSLVWVSHPFPVLRLAELNKWIESGEYAAILAGDYARRDDDRSVSVLDEIAESTRAYQRDLDLSPDPLVRAVKEMGKTALAVGDSLLDLFRVPEADDDAESDKRGPRPG